MLGPRAGGSSAGGLSPEQGREAESPPTSAHAGDQFSTWGILGCLWSCLTHQSPQVLLRAALNPLSAPPGTSGCPIPSLQHVTPPHSSVLLANCPRVQQPHCTHHQQRYPTAQAPPTRLNLDIKPVTTTLNATIQIIPSPSSVR